MVGVSSALSYWSETVVSCWKNQLAELWEWECTVSICIILFDDIFSFRKVSRDVVFAKKINQIVCINPSDPSAINETECFERFKVRIAREILSSNLNLRCYCWGIDLRNSHLKRDLWRDRWDKCYSSSGNAVLKSFLIKIKLNINSLFW